MAENLLLDFVTFLVAQGLVTGAAVDTFTDVMPDTPDDAVALFEYAGDPAFVGDFANRSVALHVRGKGYESVRAKIQAIYNTFHKDMPEDRMMKLTSTRWCIIHCRSTPYKLRTDESKRTTFIFNMGVLTHKDE